MQYSLQVKLIDLVSALSRALDIVSSILADHHAHVGYLSSRIAAKLDLDATTQRDILIAAMLHDAGALCIHPSVDSLKFESDLALHAKAGHVLLSNYPNNNTVSALVQHHHTPWKALMELPNTFHVSNIISMADFVDVQLDRRRDPLPQLQDIVKDMAGCQGSMFRTEYFDALCELVAKPEELQGIRNPEKWLRTYTPERLELQELNTEEVLHFSHLFSLVIDFRSQFTATHSRGVAECAKTLAAQMEFEDSGQKLMHIAGLLHDIGKLAVPTSILEKPGPLSKEEFAVMKQHAELSESIIGNVPGLEQVNEWAAEHHERIDGTGYPSHKNIKSLSLGSRIMQVADVFTAITEDRPYRAGMKVSEVKKILTTQAQSGTLDAAVVSELLAKYDEINAIRAEAQKNAREGFDAFYKAVHNSSCPDLTVNAAQDTDI